MLNRRITRITILLLAAALMINITAIFMTYASWAATSQDSKHKIPTRVVLKQGYNYQLTKSLKVYKGPGKDYACVKRSELKPSTRKNAVQNSDIAKLKKGTVVSCLKVKKRWMKIPSGWIYAGDNNVKKIKKHRA